MNKLYVICIFIVMANKLFAQGVSKDTVEILTGWKNKENISELKPTVKFKKNKVTVISRMKIIDEAFSKSKEKVVRIQNIETQTVYTRDMICDTQAITNLTYYLIKKDTLKEGIYLGKNKYKDVIEIENYDRNVLISRAISADKIGGKRVKERNSSEKSENVNKSLRNNESSRDTSRKEQRSNGEVKKDTSHLAQVNKRKISKDTNVLKENTPSGKDVKIRVDRREIVHTPAQLREIYRKLKLRRLFYTEFSVTPAFSKRSLVISNPQFDNNQGLQVRQQSETSTWAPVSLEAAIGWNFKPSHSFFLEFIHLRQGFQANGYAIDWSSGLPVTHTGLSSYRFRSNGFGVGYRYLDYQKIHSFAFDAGLYATWINSAAKGYTGPEGSAINEKNQLTNLHLRSYIVGAKLGFGYRWAMGYNTDLSIMPTLFYNFTPSNMQGELNTNLWNVGITAGVRFFL